MTGFILLADGAGSTQNLSIFDPASPSTDAIRSLFILVLAIANELHIAARGMVPGFAVTGWFAALTGPVEKIGEYM